MYHYKCKNCKKKIHSQFPIMDRERTILCEKCTFEKYGNRDLTRQILLETQGNVCIIKGCPFKQKQGNGSSGKLNLHRIKPGRLGGKYEPDNCVLVCFSHHRKIEGLTREEILELKCTEEEIDRMPLYHRSTTLLDYPIEIIEKHLIEMCEILGVPAKCERYNILEAVKKELAKSVLSSLVNNLSIKY